MLRRIPRKWWILIAIAECMAMLYIDQTAVSVMLPHLKIAFGLSDVGLQWVLNSFLLTLAVLIAAGGRLSDIWGIKKTLFVGIIGFLLASILCGSAINSNLLIAGRVLQGMFGAILLPVTSLTIVNIFPEKEAGTAMGIYSGSAAIFLVLGPFLGGVMTQYLSWRYVFWLNIPLAISSLILLQLKLKKQPKTPAVINTNKHRFDWRGFITLGMANTALVGALTEMPSFGLKSPLMISLFLGAILGYLAYVRIERTAENALTDFKLLAINRFTVCGTILFCLQFCLATRIYLIIFCQMVFGYTPLKASLLILPTTIPILFMAPIGGKLLAVYGPRLPIIIGTIGVALSLVWLTIFTNVNNYITFLCGLLLFGISSPLCTNPAMTTALASINKTQRGMASGIISQLRQIANTLGIAMIGAITNHISQHNFETGLASQHITWQNFRHIPVTDILLNINEVAPKLAGLACGDRDFVRTLALGSYTLGFRYAILLATIIISIAVYLAIKKLV